MPACLLVFSVPVTVHVFADALSESTFLLFWSWGLWAALRFLKDGSPRMIPLIVIGSALAYLTRPEGLLLPAAVVTTLVLSPRWVFSRLPKRVAWVVALMPVALVMLIGPYIAIKGGLGTKPSIARLIGTAPRSDQFAVERQRPLDPDQTALKTLAIASKTVYKAVVEAVTTPLALLAFVGLILASRESGATRQWTLLSVIGVASFLALMRLHATGGYCTSRHALILAMIGFGAAAYGIDRLFGYIRSLASPRFEGMARFVAWPVVFLAVFAYAGPSLVDRLNPEFGGYHEAGDWLAENTSEQAHVVDVTGWSLFYGGRSGYTFADLIAAPGDPAARWVVVREAHLRGPWLYCKQLSALVEGLEPVATFLGDDDKRPTRVYVFDRAPKLAELAAKSSQVSRTR